tara:strand:+ start:1285 stop:2199 length:915 start_codon:yes stop_codon:yes gene_type:complete
MNVHERFKDYDKNHCWQYEIRQRNFLLDLQESGMSEKDAQGLCIADFDFAFVPKEDKQGCQEIKEFIERHEWLGKMPNRPTHRFTARLRKNGILAGVVVMSTPNAFSHLLGKENRDKEKLIARGASISWSPKNMGSWLIMTAVRWMVANTEFRFFTAYSDPEAKELGTIYQACNFTYLGQTSGTSKQYLDPQHPEKGWFSDREFRKKSKYYRYASEIGIDKETWAGWMKKYSPDWNLVPPDVKVKVKERERQYRESCQTRPVPSKHKYVYILGRSKKETKFYKKLFEQNNPEKVGLPYPVLRGQ